jgi:acetyl esterase/lipase
LTPEYVYPSALDDCELVYQEILDKNQGAKVAFVGDSAGGNLCAALAIRCREKQVALPNCMVLMSAWLDLRKDSTSAVSNYHRDSVFDQTDLWKYSTLYCREEETQIPEVSPVCYSRLSQLPPTMLQVATNELLYHDSLEFADAMKEQGGEVVLDTQDNLFHAWQVFPDYLREARLSVNAISEFVSRHFE